jgi:hypothetical protein
MISILRILSKYKSRRTETAGLIAKKNKLF